MAQDPYGYNELTKGSQGDASQAMWYGVAAALLGSVGICFCYVPYLVALPLAITALVKGSRALASAGEDEKERTMANAALVTGGISTAVSGAFTLFAALYFLFLIAYFVIIVVAIAAGAASNN